jgi:signal transduction histidine kinase/ActR/RegA family two-component response regulator
MARKLGNSTLRVARWAVNPQPSVPPPSTRMNPIPVRRKLFQKYVSLFVAVVCVALVTNGLLDMWFAYQEQKALLVEVQRGQAQLAADRIAQFIKEIEGQMAWATQLPWAADSMDEWRFNTVRFFRQVPAVTELVQLDASGRELIRMSRESADMMQQQQDLAQDPVFIAANAKRVYYGPVYFVRESEPYMTLALAGTRRAYGVVVAQVNLKFIWDVVTQVKVGKRGLAYVVDGEARLIAHPDLSLVLRKTDMSNLQQIRTARGEEPVEDSISKAAAHDLQGRRVLSAHAPVSALGWLVFTESPVEEAYAPLYSSAARSILLLAAALAMAGFAGLFLARRMVVPIRALGEGAARIGGGDLTQRIAIKTGDELEALGNQFNRMAEQLRDAYATLERKVEERTSQLELANRAKSRFLAAASHDLRQPLHALGLFVAQLHDGVTADERRAVVTRIEAALSTMNGLFNALLDISKLDAGVVTPTVTEFPVARLLKQIEVTFAGQARERKLAFHVQASSTWIRSDFVRLEQIAFNLVANAIRYTVAGGVLVGCRRRGDQVRIEVWDSGPGIPADQHTNIFSEFFRLNQKDRSGGLGLGLAIVDRLCKLLGHPICVKSVVGKGTCFSVAVQSVEARAQPPSKPKPTSPLVDYARDKLILVLDDDALVLEGMATLFRSWGCRVITAASPADVSGRLEPNSPPDIIISDYHLADGQIAVDFIEQLRSRFQTVTPAILVSGDMHLEGSREARADGYHFLHKPLEPMTMRTLISQLLKAKPPARTLRPVP